jgi:cation transport ATPase
MSLTATLPILILTMVLPHTYGGTDWIFHHRHVTIFRKYQIELEFLVLWILATPVQFVCGWDFYKMAFYGI